MAKSPGKAPRKPSTRSSTKAPAAKSKPATKPAATAKTETAKPTEATPVQTAKVAGTTPDNASAEKTPSPKPIPPETAKAVAVGDAQRSGGILMPLLGGVLAAAIGAAAVLYLLPQGWNGSSEVLDEHAAKLTALQSGLDALRAEIPGDRAATIAAIEAEVSGLSASLGDLEAEVATGLEQSGAAVETTANGLAALQDTQDALTGRVGALEARPVDQAPDIAALQADVRALTERLETAAQEARDQIAAANERAAEVEQLAQAGAANQAMRSALTQLSGAIDQGGSFANELATYQAADPDAGIAPVLEQYAADGVDSLRALRADYPAAARAALAQVVTAAPEDTSLTGRMSAFLRSQTGARSLSPREGDDPDAVLSRVEAALAEGDLTQALNEVQGLPPEGLAPMQAWVDRATARRDVLAALNDLSAPKSSN